MQMDTDGGREFQIGDLKFQNAHGAPLQPTAFSFSCDGVLTHREIEEKLTVSF
jgi:hypothetical protein